MIAIIDYDAGNLKSVEKALLRVGADSVVTRDAGVIERADKVILPGVGAFGEAMEKLKSFRLIDPIYKAIEQQKPFLGICLGLQLLFEYSEEKEGCEGLSVLRGGIKRIPEAPGLKVPHIGWNSLKTKENAALFRGLSEEPYVYFVHSYYLQAEEEAVVAATTEYGVTVHASVEKDNIFACQFHPEKSGETGLAILKNFVEL
ncbi:MAG: imidazole glycerol phosphate synthase subunit HisH [Lachnospiraceae bacterium]|nr:imidazole glycerol phosphate synthase subunit HisH [Lachnospiraceae bacterium]